MIIKFIKSFFLSILSIIVIFSVKIKKIKKGTFSSMKDEYHTTFDPRTLIYLKSKKQIIFVRTQNFFLSLKGILKFNNIILFNHILNLNVILGNFFGIKKIKIYAVNTYILYLILNYIKLSEFHMLDDYRHVQLFSKICKKTNTKLYLYQHGRFSKSEKLQKNLKNLFFDKFFVWSNFFKIKLLNIDQKIDRKKILIRKKFNNFKIKKKVRSNNLIIIHENNILLQDYKKIIEKIKKTNLGLKIYFKPRPFQKMNEKLEIYLVKENINIIRYRNIFKSNNNLFFDYLLAFNSTMLLEASYFNITPIMIYKKKPALKDYIKDNVFYVSNINQLSKNLKKIFLLRFKTIDKFKSKVWL